MALVAQLSPISKVKAIPVASVFCPALAFFTRIAPWKQKRSVRFVGSPGRLLHVDSVLAPTPDTVTHLLLRELPRSCPGCGAFTQSVSPDQPGYYSTSRKSVKAFIAHHGHGTERGQAGESQIFKQILDGADDLLLSQLGMENAESQRKSKGRSSQLNQASITPVCNRCHDLLHHHIGTPVINPTVQSIQEIISESPSKYNHIYHVLDAADFPLSLIPVLQRRLSLTPQRSSNRRAKTSRFWHGRKAEMSFVITRSDLLAPRKEQVNSLMPYILRVLRDALAGSAENVRLGNVCCVSSKRGWWTKQVKEDIWNRGGAGWMVGKVNVGKSSLLESVFPKGRNDRIDFDNLRDAVPQREQLEMAGKNCTHPTSARFAPQSENPSQELSQEEHTGFLQDSLLPPAPSETPYPVLPIVSSLPGTTASPIRIPFGCGKGELIDLPGLSRGDLGDFVIDYHKPDLVMRHRVKPEQHVLKPGQSLLIGGLVRITPTTPNLTLLAYPFVPLKSHVTSTERAIAIHTQKEESGIPSIVKSAIGSRMDPAGSYPLKWDVTKQRAGPLTRKAAAGLSPTILPFVVLSTDILIEGCGWIELVAQVRKKDLESTTLPGDLFDTRPYPRVEIFSPDGKHIGVRQPMGAWLLSGEKPGSSGKMTARPRRSMKGVKKELKRNRQEQ